MWIRLLPRKPILRYAVEVFAVSAIKLSAGSSQAGIDFSNPSAESSSEKVGLHQKNQAQGDHGDNQCVFNDLCAFFVADKGLQGMAKLLSDAVHGDTSKVSNGSKTSTRVGCRFAGPAASGVQGRDAICSPFKFNGVELMN